MLFDCCKDVADVVVGDGDQTDNVYLEQSEYMGFFTVLDIIDHPHFN